MSEGDTFHEDLGSLDAFFLHAERAETPLHIGVVYLFEGQPQMAGGRGVQGIRDTLRERLHLVPRYRQKVHFRPLSLGQPIWVDDPDFDLDHHVHHAVLPRPGGDAALRELAARILAQRLDPSRPLWEVHVIEGLSRGRAALISKVHHAMVDGIASVDIGTLLFDAEPDAPAQEAPPWEPRPAPDDLSLALNDLSGLRRLADIRVPNLNPFTLRDRLANGAARLAQGAAERAIATPWAGAASLAMALVRPGPQLFFNHLVGPRRRVHHVAVDLAALREVKNVFAATVNDVVLAIVAEAMHRWLLDRGSQLPEALRIFCPVSVRDDGARGASLGNQISGLVVEAPIAEMPAVTRLARIVAETTALKRSGQAVAAQALTAIHGWAPATLQALGSRVATEPRFGLQSRVNLIVTNVPGPQIPFYTGGARLLEVWPYVPVYHTLGLSVAVVSYDGVVHFGLMADHDLVPDLARLAGHVERAAADYRAVADQVRTPVSARPARSRSRRTPRG